MSNPDRTFRDPDLYEDLNSLIEEYGPSKVLRTMKDVLTDYISRNVTGHASGNLLHHLGKLGYAAQKFEYHNKDQ